MSTLRDLLGWPGGVKAAFIRGDISVSPGRYLPREEWEASRRSLRALLPEGTRLQDGESFVTVQWADRAFSLLTSTGDVWRTIRTESDVVMLFHEWDHVTVVPPTATATCQTGGLPSRGGCK